MARLNADDLTHTRASTTAVNATKRPSVDANSAQPETVRHFNTSRALKAPKDNSSIDFAFMPDVESSTPEAYKVPNVNFNFSERKSTPFVETPEPVSP